MENLYKNYKKMRENFNVNPQLPVKNTANTQKAANLDMQINKIKKQMQPTVDQIQKLQEKLAPLKLKLEQLELERTKLEQK